MDPIRDEHQLILTVKNGGRVDVEIFGDTPRAKSLSERPKRKPLSHIRVAFQVTLSGHGLDVSQPLRCRAAAESLLFLIIVHRVHRC